MVEFKEGEAVKYVGNRQEYKGQVGVYAGRNGELNKITFKDGFTYQSAYDKSCVKVEAPKKVAKKSVGTLFATKKTAKVAKKVVKKAVKKTTKK